jgi:hypothetical protein
MHYNTINLILGNESQVNPEDSEVKKIQKHLIFVKNKLIKNKTFNLNDKQKENRKKIIEILQEYINTKQFPEHNKKFNKNIKRLPRFIDHNNTYCAVGYLMLHTVGETLPNRINNKFEYNFVKDINSQELIDWAIEYGLTLKECEMIQPTYGIRSFIVNFENIFFLLLPILFFFLSVTSFNYLCFKTQIKDKLKGKNIQKILGIVIGLIFVFFVNCFKHIIYKISFWHEEELQLLTPVKQTHTPVYGSIQHISQLNMISDLLILLFIFFNFYCVYKFIKNKNYLLLGVALTIPFILFLYFSIISFFFLYYKPVFIVPTILFCLFIFIVFKYKKILLNGVKKIGSFFTIKNIIGVLCFSIILLSFLFIQGYI